MEYKKKTQKTAGIALIIVLLTSVLGGCSNSQISMTNESKTRVFASASYATASMSEILKHSSVVVRGIVEGKGTSFEKDFLESGDNACPLIYTPVTIKVSEWIVGGKGGETVIYNEQGGETATKFMESTGFMTLKDGEEVIIVLDENGLACMPYVIFPIAGDETVKVMNFLFPDLYKIKKGDYKPVAMTVDQFITATKKAASEKGLSKTMTT